MKSLKKRTLVTIAPNDRLGYAKTLMDSGDFRHLPVVENEKLVGILSYSDVRGRDDSDAVSEAMTPNPVTVSPTGTIAQAIRLLLELKITALPLVIDGKLIGILSTSDILGALLAANSSEPVAAFLSRSAGGHCFSA